MTNKGEEGSPGKGYSMGKGPKMGSSMVYTNLTAFTVHLSFYEIILGDSGTYQNSDMRSL